MMKMYILYSLLFNRYKTGALSLFFSFFSLSFTQSHFHVTPVLLCIFAAVWFDQPMKPSGVLIMYMRRSLLK